MEGCFEASRADRQSELDSRDRLDSSGRNCAVSGDGGLHRQAGFQQGVRLRQQVGIPVGEPPGSELRSAVTAEADSGPGNSGGDGWDSGPAISG